MTADCRRRRLLAAANELLGGSVGPAARAVIIGGLAEIARYVFSEGANPLTCAGLTTYKAVKVAGTRSSDIRIVCLLRLSVDSSSTGPRAVASYKSTCNASMVALCDASLT